RIECAGLATGGIFRIINALRGKRKAHAHQAERCKSENRFQQAHSAPLLLQFNFPELFLKSMRQQETLSWRWRRTRLRPSSAASTRVSFLHRLLHHDPPGTERWRAARTRPRRAAE